MQQLVCTPPEDGENRLEELYGCYQQAPQPAAGQRHTVWFRMRMLITRLRDRWHRLTLDRRRGDLDGTNNGLERMIGWWIKERRNADALARGAATSAPNLSAMWSHSPRIWVFARGPTI